MSSAKVIFDVKEIVKEGKIVLCQGCFDLLHIGHLKHLASAKTYGDVLVVAVTADRHVNKGPGRPYFKQDLRMEMLAALDIVDYVILSDSEDAIKIINLIRPNFFVKGSEYLDLNKDITGKISLEKDAVEAYSGQLVFTDEVVFSSTKLLNNFFDPLSNEAQLFLSKASIDIDSIFNCLDKIKTLKILVVGEAIYDKYTYVNITNVASKHAILSSKFNFTETHFGGALATARHLGKVCDNVILYTGLTSLDKSIVTQNLQNIKIDSFEISEDRKIIKERFIDDKKKQLFCVDYMNDLPYIEYEQEIIHYINNADIDIILINDFGHGMFTEKIIHFLGKYKKAFLCLNVQTNSANKGFNFVTKYSWADYISIDLPEARLALSNKYSLVQDLANELSGFFDCRTLSITQGKYGTKIYQNKKETSVPVFSSEVIDTTGAGDAYFAITAPLVYLGSRAEEIGLVGNAVGLLASRIMGNKEAIDLITLKKYITTLTK